MPVLHKKTKEMLPARMIVIGFLLIIIAGTLLLTLPISSRNFEWTSPFDCLFTATSATCVTGLVVVDTYTHWSIFGQLVIMLLVQVGGLGFLTIVTFFNIAIGKKLGFRTVKTAATDLTESTFESTKKLFFNIIKYSLIIEGAGAIILMFVFVPKYGLFGVFMSCFLGVTAFCNAGFDLQGIEGEYASLTNYADNPVVLSTIAILIVLGGLGFVVWENFINIRTMKKLTLHTKTVFITTIFLILGGGLLLVCAEYNNPTTIGGMNFGEKIMNSVFTSISARTAGFNTIPMESLTEMSKLITTVLMFVGVAPASTGGGIKITTLVVMIVTVVSYLRGKEEVELLGRQLRKTIVYRTLAILCLSVCAVVACFCILYFTFGAKEVSGIDCLFEAVSAFSTTGLSTGITSITNTAGRTILIITMFIGRVGPASLILSLIIKRSNEKHKNTVIPEGNIIVG